MSAKVAVFLTAKSVDRILSEGGTSSWRLDRNNARQCVYAVCARNAHAEWVEGPEAHHSAFIVGKVSGVAPSSDHEGRYLVQFSEYALVDLPEMWKGERNPVRYTSKEEIGIDFDTLDWKPMPEGEAKPLPSRSAAIAPSGEARGLTIAEAKRGLAMTFAVPPESIEINIRG
jgi:hypothetical protein